jgi:TolA-binding protein
MDRWEWEDNFVRFAAGGEAVKIGKLSWLFLIIGVVAIAALSLAMTHSSQTERQNQLQSQLKDTQQKIASLGLDALTAKQAQITQDIAGYTAQIDSTKGKLTSDWDSIDGIKAVLQLAASHNLQVPSVKSSPVGSEQLGGAPCDTLTLDFQVQGDLLDIRAFVLDLSLRFPTAIVKTVQVNNGANSPVTPGTPPATPEPSPTPTAQAPTATVHMVIYSYGGN